MHNMANNKIVPILAVVVITFIFFYTFSAKQSKEKAPPSLEYASRLQYERTQKDKYFKENENSPISKKADFKGLKYFEVGESFKVMANLQLAKGDNRFILQTTGTKPDTLLVYGTASFDLGGKNQVVKLFRSTVNNLLFLPFKDATTGKETYGGGRYLDIPITNVLGNKVELDFNQAYHPYCVYSHDYVCPVPPKENTISVAITAGEKL